ncbi:catalase [Sinomicrobium soli]|uniref:catalase n=1 Tax=Sinomicrobium sp. N-1-3-6 TaxID=2219864 RepID=UPI000DCAF36F|nr:catalase [Sinomicrobium sp. N-1-3-6]RAV29241.1 catalase HPII [Sinomicrobium sp. N-1-3-6]
MATKKTKGGNEKKVQLNKDMVDNKDKILTTNQGVNVHDNNNTLKAGERGPSLLEDFIFREKIFHFDHERIPERIVHARGSAAHGTFTLYKSLKKYTRASFLCDTGTETPVFVRFSTVAGSKGSTDLARDARGFAVKFYTHEGIFDLVGNNIPVFFIQDAINFPDLIHAVKPEPDNEMPQAASAHDTFWDFVSLMPEAAHMVMWTMSDRAIPRSLRMMEGFGIHTFRLVNEKGDSVFVKFHWKPLLGVHGVAWDEAQKISGFDADFHRRDLWENIEKGNYPEWELGLQIFTQEEADKFSFDVLDPTKLVPEELVPVQRVGKMTLNRNPENFFAETEQAAFHPGHIVPGIDFSDDPLLQGRLFSYSDTQLSRLGSTNFHELPINRSVAPVHNNQRDGFMRRDIVKGKASYFPNSLGGGCPYHAMMEGRGFGSYPEKVSAPKVRGRSKSFADHFTQARLFYQSQTPEEQAHIADAYSFELGKVGGVAIRKRYLGILAEIDRDLAGKVASRLGLRVPKGLSEDTLRFARQNHPDYPVKPPKPEVEKSPALSMAMQKNNSIATRKIAFLVAGGVADNSVDQLKKELEKGGAEVVFIAPDVGNIKTSGGQKIEIGHSFLTDASVLYDGLYVPGGEKSVKTLQKEPDVFHFIHEMYRHCKPLAFSEDAEQLLEHTYIKKEKNDKGLLFGSGNTLVKGFISALKSHRVWEREPKRKVPA